MINGARRLSNSGPTHRDNYVTVIIDLAPIRCDSDPARLLDLREGISHLLTHQGARRCIKESLAPSPILTWSSALDVST